MAFQMHPPQSLLPLTSLRFMAAIWVAVFSFWPHLDVAFTPMLVAKGYLGVDLFFVLSGFILCHVYLDRFGTGQFSYRAFMSARLARIYPLHLLTLLAVMALGLMAATLGIAISDNVLSWSTLVPNLLLMHSWGLTDHAGWNHPSWSVSAEWLAYLAFPAFAYAAWRLRHRPIMAVAITGLCLAGLYGLFEYVAGFRLTEATFHWGALRIAPAFAYGCALYLAFRSGRARWPIALTMAAFAIVAGSVWIGSDTLIVLSFGAAIVTLASLNTDQLSFFSIRSSVWLGEISYAIYMVCAPWLMVSTNLLGRLTNTPDKSFNILIWLGLLAGLVAIAALAHHLVERPMRDFIRQKSPRHPDTNAPKSGHACGKLWTQKETKLQ